MDAQLRAMADRGTAVGLLVAAEWPIYGRYGYGPAIDACGFDIDARTHALRSPSRSGTIEVVMPERPAARARARPRAAPAAHPGAITRPAEVWDAIAGVRAWPGHPHDAGPAPRRAVARRGGRGAGSGRLQGRSTSWERNRPAGKAEVTLLVGATPEAERELWRHLCEIDWVATVTAGNRGVDDPLQLMLADGRSLARVDVFDCIWARLLDVPAALGARVARCTPIGWWSRSTTRRASRPGGGASSSRPTVPR